MATSKYYTFAGYMVNYEKFELENGLKVILHQDRDSTLAAVNVLYRLGSKNEQEEHTGLTHLFEHMMFTGTPAVPDIDQFLQDAGGENNAFTNSDYTNYYSYAPIENLELLLAIEADRMQNLDITPEKFNIQKNVVVEEFYETCLNQPYGDVWHLISDLAFRNHHYKWPTIGKTPDHIITSTHEMIREFYQYYCPNNAILSIGGNFEIWKVRQLVENWFGNIPPKTFILPDAGMEAPQQDSRFLQVQRNVPASGIYIGFHIPGRTHRDFYALDMVTDFYAYNDSSFLNKTLVKELEIFSSVDAWLSGSVDPGLLLFEGKLNEEVSVDTAIQHLQAAIDEGLDRLTSHHIRKIKNRIKTHLIQSEVNVLNKVISLAYFEYLGDIDLINTEGEHYETIETEEIIQTSRQYIDFEKSNVLVYEAESGRGGGS